MNSWGMTWMISRSIGMAIALAASTTRSTSGGPISLLRRDTAITPRLLMLRMWSPAIPACTPLTGVPAMRSASSTARWMLATVFSRSTTTPRRRPSLGALPMPTTRSSSPPFRSAMMHEILVVPMSSPTYVRVACAMVSLTSCGDGPPSTVAGARGRARALGLGGSHDHLMLESHVHLAGGGAALLQIREHHPQGGQRARVGRPGRAQHPGAVHQRQGGHLAPRDVHLRDPASQLERA